MSFASDKSILAFQNFVGLSVSVPVIGTTLGNGEEQHDIQDLLSFKQVKNKLVLPATSVDQFLKKQEIHREHDIDHDLPDKKRVKKKSLIPATSLDQFQKQQGIGIGDERKQINHVVADVEYMPAPSIHEYNNRLDALEDQEEINEDECAIDEEVDIDCRTKGISKQKQVRGKTTCKNIHARNLEEREEVTFDKEQEVGPTDKIVSELTNFIETIARNPRFINLMYTSWHVVPKDIKKRMKQQQWRHRMGPINFGRVRVALRATKENNKEPSQPEMFIATHTKTGKEIQADTQVAINRQNSGETTDDAFRVVFGKEQPGRLRCYGRSVTTSQLLQNNPALNVQDIPGVVGSNLVSPVDASSAQAVRGQHIPHSSGSTHDSVLQKLFLLAVGLILHNKIIIVIMSRNSRVKCLTS
ncbi:hypothetical protein KY289_001217 [Solanum tuberosum]|nr:hypothetical protein KY289_001217 [Solanum tuberosum]